MTEKSNSETLTTYTILNALVEGSVFGILRYLIQPQMMGWEFLHYLLLYNLIAFGLMPLAGIITDLTSNKHLFVQTGVLMIFCGLLFPSHFTRVVPLALGLKIKTVFCGVGTALFRAAASGVILRRSEHRNRDIGLFLGAAPLGTAIVLLKPTFAYYFIPIAMFTAARDDHCREFGEMLAAREAPKRRKKHLTVIAAVGLTVVLMAAAAFRFLIGEAVDLVFTSDKKLILLFSLALILGRALGGFLSDLDGNVILSLVSVGLGGYFLLAADGRTLWIAAGLFFLNLTLPALYHSAAELIPRAPAFAAGLISVTALPAAITARRFPADGMFEKMLTVEGLLLNGAALITCAVLLYELPVVKIILEKKKTKKERKKEESK